MNFRQTLNGKLVRSTREFLEAHRGWFAMDNWSLGTAVLRLDYGEPPSVRSESYLTLVFERRDGQWLRVQDQNTPIQ